MNAIAPAGAAPTPVIPDNAPFSAAQRAWLNGFLAGLYGGGGSAMSTAAAEPEEDFVWHDPALALEERLQMSVGKPLNRRLMSAMAQLDCGQCGYLCQTYAEALADGREGSAALCVPGAKPTTRALKQILAETPAAAPMPAASVSQPAVTGRPVRVVSAERITGTASAKDVRHVVIDLAGSGLAYEPGDSVSLATPADPELVTACIATLGASGEEMVPCPDGTDRTLREAFATQVDIARPLDRTTDLLAMTAGLPAEAATLRRISDGEDNVEPQDADLMDLLVAFPSARPPLADLVRSLPTLKPRLYSIASALRATPGQVHLCVSTVRTMRRGRLRNGIASSFLADRGVAHGPIIAAMQTSHFRLPADPATPVIMVGPGTGIAPFRSFLQERQALGITGKSWLFFGDQHAATDYLFSREMEAWLAAGTLSRIDLAFSRDQVKKIYVQDRMREQAGDLWQWLQDGAHFYVCGDASRMAKDVDTALRAIAMSEGRLDETQARDWIVALARQGRYLRDVY